MVIVTNTADGRVYYFYVGSWFDKQHGLEKELTPSATDPRQSMKPYMVSTTTGRIRGAGTDSNVFIDIKGQRGSSGPIKLQVRFVI